jgi:rubrerythrin
MLQISNFDQLFGFAIRREEESVALYERLATLALGSYMRLYLLELAAEERAHKALLERLRLQGRLPPPGEPLHLVVDDAGFDEPVTSDLSFEQVLRLSIRHERDAYLLYGKLAAACEDEEVRSGLLFLQGQEAQHCATFEREYRQYFGAASEASR